MAEGPMRTLSATTSTSGPKARHPFLTWRAGQTFHTAEFGPISVRDAQALRALGYTFLAVGQRPTLLIPL
jgi:hypothetical protein